VTRAKNPTMGSSMQLKYDANGLIVAVCQDHLDGSVRMVAWMNEAALNATLESGKATFYSRSRKALWTKGETSGNFLHVLAISADCDHDTLLLRVRAEGPACHTGQPTCFFTPLPESAHAPTQATPNFLSALEQELATRKLSTGTKSYTKSLLDAGAAKIGAKLLEESGEFTQALEQESEERVASEAADVLYHLMVGLQLRSVSLNRVLMELASRTKSSGHEEKASRAKD
jgi:phosphoribosyl-AMP cyclohydrolase / phosphoribosyl-ATP pyrophosphohydrolase